MPYPRQAVFAAFMDPARLARWWGPNGFTNTFQVFEPRPGGQWLFVMRGPDGTDYHNASEFVEVVPDERIVFHHGKPMHVFRMTMTFADEAGGTRVTWRMRFDSVAEADKFRTCIEQANQQNFDRWEAALAEGGTTNG